MIDDTTDKPASIIRALRSLRPNRPLTYDQELWCAELQANRLLSLAVINRPAVPTATVSNLPRIRVEHDWELPTSGATYWQDGRWIITLNASEPSARQRFSLMHELKHILDHPFSPNQRSDRQERVADHFAACVLMPRTWIKAEFFAGRQQVTELADLFNVSVAAMRYRLTHLGLAEATRRCSPTQSAMRRPTPAAQFRLQPTGTAP
jgi:hypothetical protein